VGLLDVILGRRKPKRAASDRLFAIVTAQLTLETELGLRHRGAAGVVFKPLGTAEFGEVTRDLDELLQSTGNETGTEMRREDDEFGYRWTILVDDDFEDLVTSLNAVSESLEANGYSEQLLCAVLAFEETTPKAKGEPVYWIYNYKRAAFYPFVPRRDRERDLERELRLRSLLARELPLEQEPERWFPLWDIPL
jgi:hypothetical protein